MDWILRIGAIGDLPTDDDEERLRHRVLIFGGLAMSGGGLLWGSLSVVFGLATEGLVPYGYVVITALNYLYLHRSKNFPLARSVQIAASLLLPFAFQWALGGFMTSGGMMIWAMMALVGSLSFEELGHNVRWAAFFVTLTVFSGFVEGSLQAPEAIQDATVSTTFFVLNMVVVNLCVFALTVFFVHGRKRALEELEVKNHQLATSQQALIQSEKLAALGQLVAGVAHELNTPLGAIRASVGNMDSATAFVLGDLVQLLGEATPVERYGLSLLLRDAGAGGGVITSREERAARRTVKVLLKEAGVQDASRLAERLVELGITENVEPHLPLLRAPLGPALLRAAHQVHGLRRGNANIRIAADRASKIVFALKSYVHPGSVVGEAELGEVAENLDTVATLYHNQIKHGVELVRDYQEVGEVVARHDELNQVWTNLLHNALQAIGNRGRVQLRIEGEADVVRVQVVDDGPGVPAAIQRRIFEPFFTTKARGEGSGLGLSICRQIVEEHGGTLDLVSKPGHTVFSVTLLRSGPPPPTTDMTEDGSAGEAA